MALLYSMVARGTTVLAEFSAVAGNTSAIAGNTSAIAIRVLEKMASSDDDDSNRWCFLTDRYTVYVLRCDDGSDLLFLCIAGNTFPRTIAFAYLEDIYRKFMNDYKTVVCDVSSKSKIADFSSVLRLQMELVSSNQNTYTLNKPSEICETQSIVVQSIEKILKKGEQIKQIDDKIMRMQDAAFNFSDFESLEIDMEKKCVLLATEDMHVNDMPGTSTKADSVPSDSPSDDDWETIADLPPEKLLAPVSPQVADITPRNDEKTPKRRGRGTFSYRKEELYSERVSGRSGSAEQPEVSEKEVDDLKQNPNLHSSRCNTVTSHVLVLSAFSPTMTTTELEKLFADFRGHEFVIRWVNDTTALAVFQTPSTAREALKSKKFPFAVRILEKDDILVSSIPSRDLEPPRPRPKTSTVTARRLIAHGMGIKLPPNTDSAEFKKLEEERKKRIIARQSLKEDAWGDDDD